MGLKPAGLRNISQVYVIPDSGVSRWEFEQNLIDSWGTNDGTDNTSAGYVTGAPVGTYAKDFDGVDDFVSFGSYSNTGGWTISFWVNLDSFADVDARYIYSDVNSSDEDGVRFYSNQFDGSQITFRQRNSTGGDIFLISAGEFGVLDTWQMATVTNDGSNANVYRNDATNVGNASVSEAGTIGTTPRLGVSAAISQYLDGQVDDLRIYDKALTSSEVSYLYNTGSISG